MARVCTVASHLPVEEIDRQIRSAKAGWRARRWMLIRQALVEPQPAGVLAGHFGVRPQRVRNGLSAYRQRGPAGVETPGRRQRQRAYLSLEQERELLEGFWEESRAGQVSTARGIKAALEHKVGHSVVKSTVYRLMKRHQWRKLVPRPHHPQGTGERQEAFQKTSPRRSRRS
jgi:transposase